MATNWSYNTPVNQPGSVVRANGGAGYSAIGFRDALDARRSMMGQRVPQAEYPDGYLGTITNRRQDRLLTAVQGRLTQRSYQRGVHKGERIDPSDYYWPETFNPQTGLEYQSRGMKWTAQGDVVERLVNGGKNAVNSPSDLAELKSRMGITEGGEPGYFDPIRADRLKRLAPRWR